MNARTLTLGVAAAVAASLVAADPGNGLAKGHEKQRERMAPIELEWKRDKSRKVKDEGPAPAAPEGGAADKKAEKAEKKKAKGEAPAAKGAGEPASQPMKKEKPAGGGAEKKAAPPGEKKK